MHYRKGPNNPLQTELSASDCLLTKFHKRKIPLHKNQFTNTEETKNLQIKKIKKNKKTEIKKFQARVSLNVKAH